MLMLRYAIILSIAWSMIISCATNPRIETLTSVQRSRISSIEVFQSGIQREHVVLRSVEGLSCNRNKHQVQDVTYDEAMQGVKINALLLDADAVINVSCQKNSDTDWMNNCWASIKCIGDAVKYK